MFPINDSYNSTSSASQFNFDVGFDNASSVGSLNGEWAGSDWGSTDSWSSVPEFSWNDGFTFEPNIDPWFHPASAIEELGAFPEIEPTILLFDDFQDQAFSPGSIFDDPMFKVPVNEPTFGFDFPAFPEFPEVGTWLPDFDIQWADPAMVGSPVSTTPLSPASPAAVGTGDQGFDWLGLGQKVVAGGAKTLSGIATGSRQELADSAVRLADHLTGQEKVFADFLGKIAGDPTVSDDVFNASRDAFFEARAYRMQADSLAESALKEAKTSDFFGKLTGGTLDALLGADRLLKAEEKIRNAATPEEAYRTMWETSVRFPLDVLLAAPNKLGLVTNIGADYAADGVASAVADFAVENTFDTFFNYGNQFAHYLYNEGYINRPPRYALK